ncbi:hypothetical protein KUTeg_023487 [Tegillarca granosa]|uniref:Opioid growth factor receptor (OGFr) conserved domain-containing protein n=1 Tax=Tegillarca granosa TaxID=220873 RepID=A0ABQ9E799_TEGGR|nr:hypothetical protein KUTeg_023487 [Tegillarca granosa]
MDRQDVNRIAVFHFRLETTVQTLHNTWNSLVMSASGQKPSESKKQKQTTMGNFMSSDSGTKKSSHHNWNYSSKFTETFFVNASKRDTDQYRKGYPGKKDDLKLKDNLLFYTNEVASYPDGDFIDIIHSEWFGDYRRLEAHHGYIQWIFPIRESGMNWHAQELQLHEAKAIQADPKAKARVLKSYKMMLDFYGMKLEDEETGQIVRGDNYKERFAHLNRSYHNYLRITRMLKSLGELGYEHLKRPFVEFVLEEALEKETLTNCVDSCYKYWLETIKDNKDRKNLKQYVQKMKDGYGTKYPPGEDEYDSDEMDVSGNQGEMAEGGHRDGDKYDEDSLEAKYLQEKEDRIIAFHEQMNEELLGKNRFTTKGKKNLKEQENRLHESGDEKMETDDMTTEPEQTIEESKTENNSQERHGSNTENNSQETDVTKKGSNSQETDVTKKGSNLQETDVTKKGNNSQETDVTEKGSNSQETDVTEKGSNSQETDVTKTDNNSQDINFKNDAMFTKNSFVDYSQCHEYKKKNINNYEKKISIFFESGLEEWCFISHSDILKIAYVILMHHSDKNMITFFFKSIVLHKLLFKIKSKINKLIIKNWIKRFI